jgi:POT family proton-dependent oligopeptide transporter
MYASLAIVGFVAGCTFFLCFRKGRKWSANAIILEAVTIESASNDAGYQGNKPVLGKEA